MSFAPDTIETLRARADLVALAQQATPLRRQGKNWLGCCPFHQERSPSFSVNPDKKVFYCFGCQAGGDAFAFFMRLHGIEFVEAVRRLGELYGVDVGGRSPAEQQLRQAQVRIEGTMRSAQAIFVARLAHARGGWVRTYLQDRGISPQTSKAFSLGFGGDGKSLLQRLKKEEVTLEQLQAAGMAAEGGTTCFFADRLIFPIFDMANTLVGFGGRRLNDESGGAKYLNSGESALFNKSEQLFGMAQAHRAMRHNKCAVLCEGYLDVLAAHQAGLQHSVAALGTQLTAAHSEKIARLCQSVVLLLDGDAAGARAALKAGRLLLAAGLQLQVAALPAGEDPASYAQKHGGAALCELVAAAKPALEHFIEQAFAPAGASIEARVQAADGLYPLVQGLRSGLERELYTNRIAEHVGTQSDKLAAHWQKQAATLAAQQKHKKPADKAAPAPAQGPRTRRAQQQPDDGPPARAPEQLPREQSVLAASAPRPTPQQQAIARQELEMVRELLLFPVLFAQADALAEYLVTPQLQNFLQCLAQAPAAEKLSEDILTQCVTDPGWQQKLRAVSPIVAQTLDEGPQAANRTFDDILRRLKRRHVDWTLQRVLRELGEAEQRGDATDTLLRRKQLLTARKRALFGTRK